MFRTPLAAAALSLLAASFAISTPAEAGRQRCVYMAHDASGQMMADGWADARKLGTACNRAERRCNRELERKRRQGKAGRGQCRRITNL